MKKIFLTVISILTLSAPLPVQADFFNDFQVRLNESRAIRAQERQHRQEMAFAWVMGIGLIGLGAAFFTKGRNNANKALPQVKIIDDIPQEDSALKELRLRYAKGDITEEEYLHRVEILKS